MRSVDEQKTISRFIPALILFPVASMCAAQTVNTPPQSTFFSTAAEESYSTYQITGDGDLWPSCWADDGNLYAANGDGDNFSTTFYSMAVGVISGRPADANLTGSFVAGDVGNNYSGSPYTDKPTGMLCVGGAIYLAYQNLNESTFDDAPAASIVESTDHGVTWSANPSTPMFGTPGNTSDPTSYLFTTIFFLDFGENYNNAIDTYVYAYGLDNNWRGQTAVYLARVPNNSVLDRSTWQFFTGMNGGVPTWSSDITQKVAVLTDQRELYQTMVATTGCPTDQNVIAQGGAVYDAPLARYILVTWGCATHEFYEAPQPWGPWSHFLSNDFGPFRSLKNRGQYGTSIPSKFIGPDGLTMYLQSNVCCSGDSYTFSLRKLYLQLYSSPTPANSYSTTNLALAPGTRAVSKSTRFGTLCALNCADQIGSAIAGANEDDYDEENKPADNVESFWGYTWPQAYNINQVVYTTGTMFTSPNGGWFASNLSVQVRQNFQWIDVSGVTVTPVYPYSSEAGSQTTYTFNFPDTWGDGVRIIGVPGGTSYFTSINSLQVYYLTDQTIAFTDPGTQTMGTAVPALVATATSGLSVTFTSATPSVCTVSGTTVTLVSAGTCTIDANQAGNATYAPAPQVAQSFTVNTVPPPSFALSFSPSSITVQPGGSGTSSLTVTPANGMTGSVSFVCSGLPAGASCGFSPATVTISSTTAQTTMVTISTSSDTASLRRDSRSFSPAGTLAVVLCLLFFKKRRRLQLFLLLAIGAAGLGLLPGCVAKSSQPVTSTVTVTATCGSLQQTATISLTVE